MCVLFSLIPRDVVKERGRGDIYHPNTEKYTQTMERRVLTDMVVEQGVIETRHHWNDNVRKDLEGNRSSQLNV